MHKDHDRLDHDLDAALDMTFPASDPLAAATPGSTSRRAGGEHEAETGRSPKQRRHSPSQGTTGTPKAG